MTNAGRTAAPSRLYVWGCLLGSGVLLSYFATSYELIEQGGKTNLPLDEAPARGAARITEGSERRDGSLVCVQQ